MRIQFEAGRRQRGPWRTLLWACVLVLSSPIPSGAGEPRTLYDTPIYPGDIVEPRLDEMLPSDAARYAARYRECLHWGGEEAYDEERAAEISRGAERSCTGLESERDSLRWKYPRGSSVDSVLHRVIADLDSFSDAYVWDDPRHQSAALNHYYEARAQRAGRSIDALIARRRAISDTAGEATRDVIRWMSKVQSDALAGLIANIDRLHPETAADLREARIRWEREIGDEVDGK